MTLKRVAFCFLIVYMTFSNSLCCFFLWLPEARVLIYPHTILVLLHLLAFAVGLGSALLADWIVLTRLTFVAVTARAAQQLVDLSYAVAIGLALLWITGAILVGDNALAAPATLGNHKLWAKIAIVTVLTANALLLHGVVLPRAQSRIGQTLFDATFARPSLSCTLFGAVSATSWMFAAVLGCARELNGVVGVTQVLYYYSVVLLLAWTGSLVLISWARHRAIPLTLDTPVPHVLAMVPILPVGG